MPPEGESEHAVVRGSVVAEGLGVQGLRFKLGGRVGVRVSGTVLHEGFRTDGTGQRNAPNIGPGLSPSFYVCVYTYMQICISICINICIYIYIENGIHVYLVYVIKGLCAYIYVCVCMPAVYACTYVYVCVRKLVSTYNMCVYICTIHTHNIYI